MALTTNVSGEEKVARNSFSFVVLGHVRGNANGAMNYLFDELIAEVRKLAPDLIFLTGDMIWGDFRKPLAAEVIKQDWDRLDAALGQIGIPIYRVPGNHDINAPLTRDIYFTRYGDLPQAITYRGNRFILLNSTYVPEGEAPVPIKESIGGKQLDLRQIDFIQKELTRSNQYDHVFLFMHHILWWRENEPWWRDVHPLLVGRNVRAVFGGDYGPMKFSHMQRDGIDYIQSSIEGDVPIKILQELESSRLLSQQFDNFLYVTIDGPQVTIDVKTFGEMSSGKFTPQRWHAMYQYEKPLVKRVWDVVSPPRRLVALVLVIGVSFLGGVISALAWKYRKLT